MEVSGATTEQARLSKNGLYGLAVGALLAVAGNIVPDWVLTSSSINWTLCTTEGVIALASLASLFTFVIPSLKRDKYPNITGLIALGMTLIVLYTSASALLAYTSLGRSS